MSTQYCKVGKIKPSFKKSLNVKTTKEKPKSSVEMVYKKNATGFNEAS